MVKNYVWLHFGSQLTNIMFSGYQFVHHSFLSTTSVSIGFLEYEPGQTLFYLFCFIIIIQFTVRLEEVTIMLYLSVVTKRCF